MTPGNRGVAGRFLPGVNQDTTGAPPASLSEWAMLMGMPTPIMLAELRRCAQCGAAFTFTPYPSLTATGRGRYCSRPCAFASMQRRVVRPCQRCGEPVSVKRGVAARSGWFCSTACRHPGTPDERFWQHVQQWRGADGCWPWVGDYNAKGYGLTKTHPQISTLAHRVAWVVNGGMVPGALLVCHRCDNPPCCNPGHLFLGTAADNARDKVRKGRHGPRAGEQNGAAKLTWPLVREFRRRHAAGETVYRLAKAFGVSYTAAKYVANGAHWKEPADG